jgi:DNA-binding NarL/FixJ family response regulator
MEIRPIPGWEGLYSDSDAGHIWSHVKNIWLSESMGAQGYTSVCLKSNGRQTTSQVHRLIAAAWLGPRPPGLDVNHINAIKHDNRPCNLEYMTRKENVAHAMRMGLMKPSRTRLKHIGISQRKLSIEQAKEIQRLYANGHLQKHLAEQFYVSKTTIRNVIFGRHYVATINQE